MAGRDGEVVFEIRGDDSNLNRDLSAAQQKVEKSTQKGAEKTEQIEQKTAESVKKSKADVTEYHEQQNDQRVKDDQETGKQREEAERSTGEKIKSIAGGTAKAIGAGMIAAGAAAVSIGTMAVKSATDMDQAMNQFISSTGKSVEETEKYQKVLENIYTNNYGDSFEDIADSMAVMQQQMGYIEDDELQGLVESAYALRDTFGYEVPESARAASTMMTQFGISGEEAMSLIAAGAQNGLDFSGELLDSINEYSVQFAKVGLDADDMFKIFQQGAASGAWNLDKIGDAVKEFSIRAIDGSDSTAEGFEKIGLNADEMAAKFAAGGDTAKTAFQDTVRALAAMEDPLEQNIAGTDLFGTMWEDLGPEAVAALAEIEEGAYDTANAMDSIKEVKYDDLGSMLEGLKRSAEMLLVPLGEQLIPILTELIEAVLPMLQEALPPILEIAGQLIEQITPVIEELLPLLLDTFSQLIPPLMEIVNAVLPPLALLLAQLLPPLAQIISALLPPLMQLVSALMPVFQSLLSVLMPVINCFVQLLNPIVQLISSALVPLVEALTPIITTISELLVPVLEVLLSAASEVFSGLVELVGNQIQRITDILKNVIDFIKNVFTGNWKGAWENVKNIFKTIADSLGSIWKAPINAIIDLINGFLKGLNKIKIPDWVPGVGGKGFNIPTIPRLKTGIDFVPGDYFPAYLDYGERVLTQQENLRFNALGGLAGMETALSQGGYDAGQKIVLGKGCIIVQTNIEGKEAARTLAPYMDTELGDVKEVGGRNEG
ncbi:MAG: phage tail tape measure protein [Clostridiaceae bacterium]|nr:phage tail tape measure protein [Clostridiaceae bacterium]